MHNERPTLEVKGLRAGYGALTVLRDVTIAVPKGSIVTLIGANGAGKSTLIKAIFGLIGPSAGSVHVFGQDMTGQLPDKMVRAGVGLVPEGRRLFNEMTLRENLELGAYTRQNKAEAGEDFDRVLALFPELKDRLSVIAGTFSGGQQQMVAIARALMSAPRLLLLDEPTIGLAPVVVERVVQLVEEISKLGVDILLIEQNAEVALSVATYGFVLENGQVVLEGNAAELLENPAVQQAYLGI